MPSKENLASNFLLFLLQPQTAEILSKQKVLLIHNDQNHKHSVTSLNTTAMFHIFITVQINNTETCEKKGHVLTDTVMAQRQFALYPQLMQQMWWLTMEECLIILKALSAS